MKYYMGIDLGGTTITACIISDRLELVKEATIPTFDNGQFDTVVSRMKRAAEMVLREAGMQLSELTAVGIGIPGIIEGEKGPVIFAPNVGWSDINPVPELEKELGLPVFLGNDAGCAALGEALAGAGEEYRNIIMLTLGTAVGGAVVFDGRLFTGFGRYGGEIGHIPLKFDGDTLCSCGSRGCYQQYASGVALARSGRKAVEQHSDSLLMELCSRNIDDIDAEMIFKAAGLGDEYAAEVVESYLSDVSGGIAGLVNIFRPDAVVIGGGVSNAGDILFEELNKKVGSLCYASEFITPPPIVGANLGNCAGTIGAGALAMQYAGEE